MYLVLYYVFTSTAFTFTATILISGNKQEFDIISHLNLVLSPVLNQLICKSGDMLEISRKSRLKSKLKLRFVFKSNLM